jgi:hypothetical protein
MPGMRRLGSRTLALVAVSALLAAGCGDDDEGATPAVGAPESTETSATEATAGSSTTAAPTSTTSGGTPVTEPTEELPDSDTSGRSELADGRHFGFWDSFEIGDTIAYGEFDLASFLTGPEAEAEAAARGDEVNNDYYIVNDNDRLRTLIAAGDTEVLVLTGGEPDLSPSNVADFAVDRNPGSGFWVTIADGIVTVIEEQFVP